MKTINSTNRFIILSIISIFPFNVLSATKTTASLSETLNSQLSCSSTECKVNEKSNHTVKYVLDSFSRSNYTKDSSVNIFVNNHNVYTGQLSDDKKFSPAKKTATLLNATEKVVITPSAGTNGKLNIAITGSDNILGYTNEELKKLNTSSVRKSVLTYIQIGNYHKHFMTNVLISSKTKEIVDKFGRTQNLFSYNLNANNMTNLLCDYDTATTFEICNDTPNIFDDIDNDGINSNKDECPETKLGLMVLDINGCEIKPPINDNDDDGVINSQDNCPDTTIGSYVGIDGCESTAPNTDADGDGVINSIDICPNTLSGTQVGTDGCSIIDLDPDSDGILGMADLCPGTLLGVSVDKNGCEIIMNTTSLANLAATQNIDVSGMQKIHIANYTDPFTFPQTKATGGECTHQHKVTDDVILCNSWNTNIFSGHFGECTGTYVAVSATYACDTWSPIETWRKVMNCDVYLNLPMAESVSLKVVQGAVSSVVQSGVDFAKQQITNAILVTLGEAGVASAVAGFGTVGTGAAPAFAATFSTQIIPNLEIAKTAIITYFGGMTGMVVDKIPMPKISKDNVEFSCGWDKDWHRI